MRVVQLGEGDASVAVIGSIHGDEPCGRDGIEAVLDDPPEVSEPVKFVIANEDALAAGKRYLDVDLNRSFPGNPDSDAHEERLAARLSEELQGCTVLALHSTQSYGDMFALVDDITPFVEAICPQLSVDAVVRTKGANEGRIFSSLPDTIEVECGYQGSPTAAANAEQIIREFLVATGVTDNSDPVQRRSLPVYQLGGPIPKTAASEYEVFAQNFTQLAPGDPIAAADSETVHADESFYPVLLSAEGYEDVFGYRATEIGTLN